MNLFAQLDHPSRVSSVDCFRGIAILVVVLYHVGFLPDGLLGVDLFFVISGYLVSAPLIGSVRRHEPVRYLRFVVTRGFKIWPSYYLFLAAGSLVAFLLYGRHSHPQQLMAWRDVPMFAFFYDNYRGGTHRSFDHLWSLGVEEHFYVLLPVLFLLVQRLRRPFRAALVLVAGVIVAGVVLKYVSYRIGFDTYSATHDRIDALAWGVLLSLLTRVYKVRIEGARRVAMVALGLVLLFGAIVYHRVGGSVVFNQVFFHAVVPFACFLLMFACLELDWRRAVPLRLMAYYSYNWYLWHVVFVEFFLGRYGHGPKAAAAILVSSFLAAVAATVLVEEPMLTLRAPILQRLFGSALPATPASAEPVEATPATRVSASLDVGS